MGSFGELLREHRDHAGLTQEELAERAGISVRTIRNLEAGKVATPRLSSLRPLADALGVDGADRHLFIAQARHSGVPEPIAPGRFPGPLTSFVGRSDDLAIIADLVESVSPRLITLTGVAGVGKTRLARAVAEQLTNGDRQVWWVGLSAVVAVEHVLEAVADAVGEERATYAAIGRALRGRLAVCILDNLEHLDGIADVLRDLLDAVPDATFIGTSRAPVGLAGEHEYPVAPLAIPLNVDVDQLAQVESVGLLVDRIVAADPTFELTTRNAACVVEVCRLLDGLPLALELAARQWRLRGGEGLVATLRDNPLDLADVTGSRSHDHVSVARALAASYALLTDETQHVLNDLSAFRGGWTLDGARAVVGIDSVAAVASHHDRLLSLGLIEAADTMSGRRFSMLAIIQAFARARAEATGSSPVAAGLHADHYRRWAGAFDVFNAGADRTMLRDCDAERENLRAALAWFVDRDPPAGLDLAVNLAPYWSRRGRNDEALAWMELLLSRAGEHPGRPFALMVAANQAYFLTRVDQASSLATESLDSNRRRGDVRGCVQALGTLGMIHVTERPGRAVECLEEAASLARSIGYQYGELWTLSNLAEALLQLGRLDDVLQTIDGPLRSVAERIPHFSAGTLAHVKAAEALRLSGNPDAALVRLVHADLRRLEFDDVNLNVHWLVQHAMVAARLGTLDEAASAARQAVNTATDAAVAESHLVSEAALAMAEVHLSRGERPEARDWFVRSIGDDGPSRYPMQLIEAYAGLAAASDDAAIAASAAASIESLRHRVGTQLPLLVQARMGVVITETSVGADSIA